MYTVFYFGVYFAPVSISRLWNNIGDTSLSPPLLLAQRKTLNPDLDPPDPFFLFVAAWETQYHYKDADEVPAYQPMIYVVLTILVGLAGFYVNQRLAQRGHVLYVHKLWFRFAFIAVAILGFHYRAFLFTGSYADWHGKNPVISIQAFFSSSVFYSLLAGAALLVPTHLGFILPWLVGPCIPPVIPPRLNLRIPCFYMYIGSGGLVTPMRTR